MKTIWVSGTEGFDKHVCKVCRDNNHYKNVQDAGGESVRSQIFILVWLIVKGISYGNEVSTYCNLYDLD